MNQLNLSAIIGWILVIAALFFYVYGISVAISISWSEEIITEIKLKEYPPEIASLISTMQALLLTNLGIYLGISVANLQSQNEGLLAFKLFYSNIPSPISSKGTVQLLAIAVYVISLIACVITWFHNKFSSDAKHVVSVIFESSKMFIGLIAAYITTIFSTKN